MTTINAKGMPIWDGNPDKLPPMGKTFVYKEEEFVWHPCPCGCGHPTVVLPDGDMNFEMTIRLRGTKQGYALYSVLVKLGRMEEVIACDSNRGAAADLLARTLAEIPANILVDEESFMEFLAGKGIYPDEIADAVLDAMEISAPPFAGFDLPGGGNFFLN